MLIFVFEGNQFFSILFHFVVFLKIFSAKNGRPKTGLFISEKIPSRSGYSCRNSRLWLLCGTGHNHTLPI